MNQTKIILPFILLFSFALLSCGSEDNSSRNNLLKIPATLENLEQYIPDDNTITEEKITLGKRLFFDERLSIDGTVSCAFCHNPMLGFSDGRYTSMGIYGYRSKRNAPTLINRLFSRNQFLDGRAKNIEEAILEHIQNSKEMANNPENIVKVLSEDEKYRIKFEDAFGTDITIEGIAKAVAAFVRTLFSGNSLFDQFIAGNKNSISQSAQKGYKLFISDRLNCLACHSGANFTDEEFHNNGAGWNSKNPDPGRYFVSQNESDKGKFKTPTLRDIARSSPFMHNGSIKSLLDVVEFYNKGGIPNKYLSEKIKPLNLSRQEKDDLVEFLRSLTGTNNYHFGY